MKIKLLHITLYHTNDHNGEGVNDKWTVLVEMHLRQSELIDNDNIIELPCGITSNGSYILKGIFEVPAQALYILKHYRNRFTDKDWNILYFFRDYDEIHPYALKNLELFTKHSLVLETEERKKFEKPVKKTKS